MKHDLHRDDIHSCQSDSHRWQARTSRPHDGSTCYGNNRLLLLVPPLVPGRGTPLQKRPPMHTPMATVMRTSSDKTLRTPSYGNPLQACAPMTTATRTSYTHDRPLFRFWGKRLNRQPPAWSVQEERGSDSTSNHGWEPDPDPSQ
jgi:hypothetical protein